MRNINRAEVYQEVINYGGLPEEVVMFAREPLRRAYLRRVTYPLEIVHRPIWSALVHSFESYPRLLRAPSVYSPKSFIRDDDMMVDARMLREFGSLYVQNLLPTTEYFAQLARYGRRELVIILERECRSGKTVYLSAQNFNLLLVASRTSLEADQTLRELRLLVKYKSFSIRANSYTHHCIDALTPSVQRMCRKLISSHPMRKAITPYKAIVHGDTIQVMQLVKSGHRFSANVLVRLAPVLPHDIVVEAIQPYMSCNELRPVLQLIAARNGNLLLLRDLM